MLSLSITYCGMQKTGLTAFSTPGKALISERPATPKSVWNGSGFSKYNITQSCFCIVHAYTNNRLCNCSIVISSIYHISRSVREAAGLLVLTGQDVLFEQVCVNPLELANYAQRGDHPPAVADVLQLFGSSVEAARGQLSFGQPPAQQVAVYQVKPINDRQKANTTVDLANWSDSNNNNKKFIRLRC